MRPTSGAHSFNIQIFLLSLAKDYTNIVPKLLIIELINTACNYKSLSLNHCWICIKKFKFLEFCAMFYISILILPTCVFKISNILFKIQAFNIVIIFHCSF